MTKLVLENVFLEINKIQIASGITLGAKGMCCLVIDPFCDQFRELPLLFSKNHLYSVNEIKIDGIAYLNGKKLHISKFHNLLNQSIVFEGGSTVLDALNQVNRHETERLLRILEIQFTEKRVDHLSIHESRIFEVAVCLASKPPVSFLRTQGMSCQHLNRCITALKEFVNRQDAVVIVESEFTDDFDSALIFQNEKIQSLNKKEAKRFFRDRKMAPFLLPSAPKTSYESLISTEIKEYGFYDYKAQFKKYKTHNIIDLKHRSLRIVDRICTLDFYKVNLRQAAALGYKRYENSFQKREERFDLIRSMSPIVFSILIYKGLCAAWDSSCVKHLPLLIVLLIETFFDRKVLGRAVLHVILNFVVKEGSSNSLKALAYTFFTSGFQGIYRRLILACVCLGVLYQYSSIFEEDTQALNYNVNILFTPGTYICSVLVYAFLAHMITLIFLGFILKIEMMLLNVIGIFFINLICFWFIGRRLRSSIIGFFISLYCMGTFQSTLGRIFQYFVYLAFPTLYYTNNYIETGEMKMGFSSFYLIFYFVFVYLASCYHLSYF